MEGSNKAVVPYHAGWFNTALAGLLPYLIWVPYQVYLSLIEGGWRDFMKQMTTGTGAWGSHGSRLPNSYSAPSLPQEEQKKEAAAPTARGATWEALSPNLERYSVRSEGTEPPRRLVLMYAWLTSKRHHVRKYASLFTELGMDVVTVKITGMDLMQPTSGTQVVAQQVVQFLDAHPHYTRVLVFGFSVGAYAFSEAVKLIHETPEHANIAHRLVGHVWDSPVDLPNMPIGVATTVTANEKIRSYVSRCVDWFLRTRHDVATRHYLAAANYFYSSPVHGPALYLYSSCDPLSPVPVNERIARRWQELGYDVTTKVFEDTPHCAHFSKYPTEYRRLVLQFLEKIDFLQ